MHRSSTTSALEPSASVISLCQSSSFGHAQSCTGCLASPQFVRLRNRSGEPRHDHPHELASPSVVPNPNSQSERLRTSNQGIFDRADDVYVDVERKFAEALVRD